MNSYPRESSWTHCTSTYPTQIKLTGLQKENRNKTITTGLVLYPEGPCPGPVVIETPKRFSTAGVLDYQRSSGLLLYRSSPLLDTPTKFPYSSVCPSLNLNLLQLLFSRPFAVTPRRSTAVLFFPWFTAFEMQLVQSYRPFHSCLMMEAYGCYEDSR